MDDPELARLSEHLGDNLRFVRQRRGITQGQLAKLCDVPRSTIANLEAGGSNPTLSVLSRLSRSLHLSLEELLSPPKVRCQLFPSGTLPVKSRARGRARVHKLLPHAIPGMEIDRFELESNARITGVPHRPGTHEYLCCERGELRITVEGERFDLRPGDVATFPGDQAHGYHNTGSELAVAFSVVTLAPLSGAVPD
jgi:transcriptional regulator with XRE-family HTH domain